MESYDGWSEENETEWGDSTNDDIRNETGALIETNLIQPEEFTPMIREIKSQKGESVFILKWTIVGFNCTTANKYELMPSLKFDFPLGTNMHYYKGNITISGESCDTRMCKFNLQNLIEDRWRVSCQMKSNIYEHHTFLSQDKKSHNMNICLPDHSHNIIEWKVKCVSYKQIEQPTLPNRPISTLQKDMANLFESKLMSDITFEVGGEKILGHKLIIANRSKIFAHTFEKYEMNNMAMSNIFIEDITPKVFTEILRYIYTDRVLDLNQMAIEMLIASHLYGLENLKIMCEWELQVQTNIENAAEFLMLAEDNEAKQLKDYTIQFIKTNRKKVAETVSWEILTQKKLHLIAELFIALT